jgi:hypothetical protein
MVRPSPRRAQRLILAAVLAVASVACWLYRPPKAYEIHDHGKVTRMSAAEYEPYARKLAEADPQALAFVYLDVVEQQTRDERRLRIVRAAALALAAGALGLCLAALRARGAPPPKEGS